MEDNKPHKKNQLRGTVTNCVPWMYFGKSKFIIITSFPFHARKPVVQQALISFSYISVGLIPNHGPCAWIVPLIWSRFHAVHHLTCSEWPCDRFSDILHTWCFWDALGVWYSEKHSDLRDNLRTWDPPVELDYKCCTEQFFKVQIFLLGHNSTTPF